METIAQRPAALDVHEEQVTACVRVPAEGSREQHVAEFSTTVAGLLALRDWLSAFAVGQVTMEATGVYWSPQRVASVSGAFHRGRERPTDKPQTVTDALT